MDTTPYFDLKRQHKKISREILKKIRSVSEENAFTGGDYIIDFEKNFARFLGAKYAIGVNCGTSALHLCLIAAGVRPGDEVIIPALTFIATADVVSYLGAKPVFTDVVRDTWQISPDEISKKISKKTKAIIGVHLFGQPFEVDKIVNIAKEHNLILIEDCAQSHGACFKGKKVGTFGDFAAFSFYPSKNLGAWGQAGAIITKNRKAAERLKKLRDHGRKNKITYNELGYNYMIDGIQAAVLDTKLKYLPAWNRKRQHIAKRYLTEITNKKIRFQYQPAWSESVFYLFVVTVADRNKFRKFLKQNHIETACHYIKPLPLQDSYSYLNHKTGDFPVAEYYATRGVSIPMFPELTDNEVTKIIKVINQY